jgi:hypothetical protein
MSTVQELRASFDKGQVYAKINSTKDAIVRTFQLGVPAVVAWNLPIAWYWRIVAFFVMFKLIAIVVTTRRARRDRLQKLHRVAHARLHRVAYALWCEEMEAWLRRNPDATEDELLVEAGQLIDKLGLRASPRYSDRAETIAIEPQITPAAFEEMYLKKQDFGPEAGEIMDLLVRAGIGVGKYERYPKPPIFWRKAAKAANELRAWLRQNPTASSEARQTKARSVVDINRLVHRSLRMS